MRYGLGPRWAVMGALTTFTLAGGTGGMPHVLTIAPELQKWMDALGSPKLTAPDVQAALIKAAAEITQDASLPDLIAWRNDKLVDLAPCQSIPTICRKDKVNLAERDPHGTPSRQAAKGR